MIEALFGSRTRVKLLHLFLNNPGKSFYVREITRLIDEQINSVRRELSNMMGVGIVSSFNINNKLYYKVNQRYEYYLPLRTIFSDSKSNDTIGDYHEEKTSISDIVCSIKGAKIVIASGVLVSGSKNNVDLLVVGEVSKSIVDRSIKEIENHLSREINYSVLSYNEFYYRLSVRDKFIMGILNDKHVVIVDKENILKSKKED